MEAGRVWGAERKPCQFESGHTDQDLIYSGALAQLARASALQAESHRFKSDMFHQYMKEVIDMVVEEFKIGSRVRDKISSLRGTVTDIFATREMDDEECDITVMMIVKWDCGAECIVNLHSELVKLEE